MKKYLLLVLSICMGTAASAQSVYTLETTNKKGANHGQQRLVSNDERNICFRTIADRMYADLNPATHGVADNAGWPVQGMPIVKSDNFHGYTEQGGEATLVGTVLNTLPWINSSTNNAQTPDWINGGSLDTYYGNYSGDATHYVDLTDYSELRVFRTSDAGFRAFFWNSDGSGTTQLGSGANGVTWNADGSYWSLDLSKAPTYQGKIYLKCIKSNYVEDDNTVTDIQVYKTEYVRALLQEDVLNTLQYHNMDGSNATATWHVGNWDNGENTASDTYYGSGSSGADHYVDLSAYDELRIYRDDQTNFRAFFINADGTGTNQVDNFANHTDWVKWNASEKYFAIDLSKIPQYDGKVYLNTIKSGAWGQNNTVNNITACQLSPASINREANCSYTYDPVREVGTFSYSNVRTGNAAINLFYGLQGNLTGYENFVIRTLNCSTPLDGQSINIHEYSGDVHGRSQTHRYCLQFCDANNAVIHELIIYSEDFKVVRLKEFFTDEQFNSINSVWLSTAGGDTDLSATIQVKEAYFITPYDLNKSSETYPLGEYFYDMDDEYIGNAYIHPSYFMLSNGVSIDEVTGVISVDPNVYVYNDLSTSMYSNEDATSYVGMEIASGKTIYGLDGSDYADLAAYSNMYVCFDQTKAAPVLNFNGTEVNASNISDYGQQNASGVWQIDLAQTGSQLSFIKAGDGSTLVSSVLLEKISTRGIDTANGEVNKDCRIQLSVPFAGFDMSDVTMVSMDNAEDGDVIGRWICGYLDYFRTWNVPEGERNDPNHEKKQVYLAAQNENPHDIRTLYVSRYNAEFEPPVNDGTYAAYQSYKDKVNNMYWDTANREDRTQQMTIYDICITKNHVITRNGGNHTKLSKAMYNNPNACEEIGNSGGSGTTLYGDGGVGAGNYADLTNYYKMQIKGTANAEVRILANRGVVSGRDYKETFVRLDSKGLAVVDLAQTIKDEEVYHLNAIKVPFGGTDAGIEYIKLYGEEDGVIDLNPELFHSWIRDENVPVTRRTGRYSTSANFEGIFDYHVGNGDVVQPNSAIFGTGHEFHPENYAELTGYKTLRVYGTEGMVPRIVFNCVNGSKTGEPKFNAIKKTIPADGYVDFDLTPYAYFHLNTLKNDVGAQAGEVSAIKLIADERVDYILEGNGTLSRNAEEANDVLTGGKNAIPFGGCALDAINDPGARVIDARPRVNLSRSSLVFPENPNCLYLMRENLTKKQSQRVQFDTPSDTLRYGATGKNPIYANMVKISGTLDEGTHNGDGYQIGDNGFNSDAINIYDGYPFSAPRDINATNATLRRKTTSGVVGTLILPFETSDIKGTAYDTFASRFAKVDSEGNGILKDTHINKGDHVLLFEEHSGAVKAYWPYLYVADASNDLTEFTYSGVIGKTPEIGSEDAPGEYMSNESVANDSGQRHYLQGFMESTHVENVYGYTSAGTLVHAANATVAPFRVMIQSPQDINEDIKNESQITPTGEVKVVRGSSYLDDDDTPTAIENIEGVNAESIVDVYTIGGAQIMKNVKAADALRNLPKGVYVVGGKKVVK